MLFDYCRPLIVLIPDKSDQNLTDPKRISKKKQKRFKLNNNRCIVQRQMLTLLLEIFNATVFGGNGVGNEESCKPEQFTITEDTTGLPGTISIRNGLHVQFSMHFLFNCNGKLSNGFFCVFV